MDRQLTDAELLAFIESAANRGHTIATTRVRGSDRLAILELAEGGRLMAAGQIDEQQERMLQTTKVWRNRIHQWAGRFLRNSWRQWARS